MTDVGYGACILLGNTSACYQTDNLFGIIVCTTSVIGIVFGILAYYRYI